MVETGRRIDYIRVSKCRSAMQFQTTHLSAITGRNSLIGRTVQTISHELGSPEIPGKNQLARLNEICVARLQLLKIGSQMLRKLAMSENRRICVTTQYSYGQDASYRLPTLKRRG